MSSLSMGASMRVGLHQSFSQSLQHRMALNQVLALGPQGLDALLARIARDPESVNGDLGTLISAEKGLPPSPSPRSSFSPYVPSTDGGPDGYIPFPPESLQPLLPPSVEVQPDVFFVRAAEPTDTPTLLFGASLVPQQTMDLAQLPGPASQLYKRLMSYRDWSTRTAREAYQHFASEQREYINTTDLLRLHEFSRASLGDELGIHETTVTRLLSPQYVGILSPEHTFITSFPTLDLSCTRDEMIRFDALSRLNAYFKTEADNTLVKSDGGISAETDVNRRTISKYRGHVGIPDYFARQKAYTEAPRTYFFPLTRHPVNLLVQPVA